MKIKIRKNESSRCVKPMQSLSVSNYFAKDKKKQDMRKSHILYLFWSVKTVYGGYPSMIAPVGQAAAQLPQLMHLSASIL